MREFHSRKETGLRYRKGGGFGTEIVTRNRADPEPFRYTCRGLRQNRRNRRSLLEMAVAGSYTSQLWLQLREMLCQRKIQFGFL